MDVTANIHTGPQIQLSSLQDQVDLISECLLMAGAIKRHNEDAAMILGDVHATAIARDMSRVIDGADGLLTELDSNSPLNAFEAEELKMVWNKLRHLVSATYQGEYFSTRISN